MTRDTMSTRAQTRRLGPGFLVSAAFIGPGTVTTASLAGAQYGLSLAWGVVFAILATLVLQEMALRLGVVAGRGLGEDIRQRFRAGPPLWAAAALVVLAIGLGNAAYQGGNLTGAAIGLEAITGGDPALWILGVAGAAGVLLWTGSYRLVSGVLVWLVVGMSALFLVAAVLARPSPAELFGGLLLPSIPAGGLLFTLALVGTTVVPYNLFLHAAAASRHWAGLSTTEALAAGRRDARLGIALGGLVTLSVMVSALPLFLAGVTVGGVREMALQLEPVLGPWAGMVFAAGLAAAGLTSAVTAPLAAAWAVAGVLGWDTRLDGWRVRGIWATVLCAGTVFALTGTRPLALIVTAQATNALLLPLIAVFLVLAANDRRHMGAWVNTPLRNAAAALVLLLVTALGVLKLADLLGSGGG